MNITINIVEVASDLAHQALLDEIQNPLSEHTLLEDEDELYNFDEEGNGTYKEEYQEIFNRHYDYFFEAITNKMDTTYFPIARTCREDLEGIGFDVSNVDDSTMEQLASKLGNDYVEQLYWIALPIIAKHLEIPLKEEENEGNK